MAITLYSHQLEVLPKIKNGCILCGSVGSGKSITALSYYYLQNGGEMESLEGENYIPMDDPPQDLYIITTAQKRDKCEWNKELAPFLLSPNPECNLYQNKVIINSWNNIGKYTEIEGAFFIFDEQRVVGSGAWVKAFLQITKKNQWILLTATPGDTWQDYIPVFIANGFYRNRSEFNREHIVYSRYSKYPKVDRYLNTGKLIRLRNEILVKMDYNRETVSHHKDIFCDYDTAAYRKASRTRWNPFKNAPISNAAELCYVWRRIVNSSESRQLALLKILDEHPKAIIFYNFDYELEMFRKIFGNTDFLMAEWNGHLHQPVPQSDSWVYLVQYTAGCEGWNCITTDTIIFYSQNYSYKMMEQAAGRINRLNTPFTDLYFYHLKSRSGIDLAISQALKKKENFNEKAFVKW